MKVESSTDQYYFYCKYCGVGCNSCDSNNCKSCATNYFLENGSCFNCNIVTPNCSTCISRATCSGCASKFYLEFQACKPCIVNCNKCINAASCDDCDFMYRYDPALNICKEKPFLERVFIYVVIIGVILGMISCAICCCVLRARQAMAPGLGVVTIDNGYGYNQGYNQGGFWGRNKYNHHHHHHHNNHHHGHNHRGNYDVGQGFVREN